MEKSTDVKIQYLADELARRCESIEQVIIAKSEVDREYNGRLRAYQEVLDFVENLFEDVIYKDENS